MHDDGIFDAEAAARYDESAAPMFHPAVLEPTVDFLAGLAGNGRALEFAIGTGRVAVPLAQRGVDVAGIELSRPMAAKLAEKEHGGNIEVVIGDMTTATVPGSFRLVYLVYNTIGNVLTQDAQVAVFINAAAHLEPGGYFVVEVGVPGIRGLLPGETVRVFHLSADRWGFDEFDTVTQSAVSHHFKNDDGRFRHFPCPFRYVWPSELDLMARLAGMELSERWSTWTREPFTADSTSHISVWVKR